MPKKRQNIGYLSNAAKRNRLAKQNETEEQRAERNERNRLRLSQLSSQRQEKIKADLAVMYTSPTILKCKKRKGPPRKHPMRNRLSKAQRLRRAREKEGRRNYELLIRKTNCNIEESHGNEIRPHLLDDCLTGMTKGTEQKEPPPKHTTSDRFSEAQRLRRAREKEAKRKWELLKCRIKSSFEEKYGNEIRPHLLDDYLTHMTKGTKQKGPPRKHPMQNSLSKAQRLRRAREKEARMKLLKEQLNIEYFQDYSEDTTDRHSMPSTSRESLNPSEENQCTSDSSQNLIIVDAYSVIKTEILDPSEENQKIFQNDSQYSTILDSKPVVDSSRTNTKIFLPNVNIDPLVKTENLNSFGTSKFPLINVKKEPTDELPKIDRTRFKKKVVVKRLRRNYVALVKQGDAHQLSLCKTDNHTLRENIKDIEKFKLNPNFGKINYNMNKVDDFANQSFWNAANVL